MHARVRAVVFLPYVYPLFQLEVSERSGHLYFRMQDCIARERLYSRVIDDYNSVSLGEKSGNVYLVDRRNQTILARFP